MHSDLFYANDKFVWGKLSASDLNCIGGLLRSILLPLADMAQLPEILGMIVRNEAPHGTAREHVRGTRR
jgi:hypothetical protein